MHAKTSSLKQQCCGTYLSTFYNRIRFRMISITFFFPSEKSLFVRNVTFFNFLNKSLLINSSRNWWHLRRSTNVWIDHYSSNLESLRKSFSHLPISWDQFAHHFNLLFILFPLGEIKLRQQIYEIENSELIWNVPVFPQWLLLQCS